MADLPSISAEPDPITRIVSEPPTFVKGKITPIPLVVERVAPALRLGGRAPAVSAILLDLVESLSPPARLYNIIGLPWPCRVQINHDAPLDSERIRELIEMELAEDRQ